jgi:hypothetical protein
MRHAFLLAIPASLLLSAIAGAQAIEITVTGGKQDLRSVPVCVPLNLAPAQANQVYAHLSRGGRDLEGQLTTPGIMTESIAPAEGRVRRDLHFVLPALKAGESLTLTATLLKTNNAPDTTGFFWLESKKGEQTELYFDVLSGGVKRRPVLRYMHAAYDNSSPERRNRTYKVFHHLYDPMGKRIVTNGGHTDAYSNEKDLLYPHHRGLMYAFNQISYGEGLKTKADTWHAKPGDTHQSHVKVLSQDTGPVLGRHRVLVSWHGPASDVFANEERELTVYQVPGGQLVEFASRLRTAGGTVRLDGDPQHAGFQFRAANEVAQKEIAKQTYYLRPDGKGKPGETRNWEPKTKQGPVDLPWDAMSFLVGGQRYTAAYLNALTNPRDSRFSERDYGRFGCYFKYDVTEDRPLVVNYRVWLQDGEMTGTQVQDLYDAFTQPVRVSIK